MKKTLLSFKLNVLAAAVAVMGSAAPAVVGMPNRASIQPVRQSARLVAIT